jgi:hypothetical protein
VQFSGNSNQSLMTLMEILAWLEFQMLYIV